MEVARSIGGSLAVLSALAAAGASVHCSSEDERPPPYTRPPVEDPKGCVELRTSGKLMGNEFSIEGKRANCAAEGLECTLQGTSEFAGQCDAGTAIANCAGAIWRFQCSSPGDAGGDGAP